MSIQINPPPQIQIPKKIQSDPELFSFYRQILTVTRQLYDRVGGPTDTFTGLSDTLEAMQLSIDALGQFDEQIGQSVSDNTDNIQLNIDAIQDNAEAIENLNFLVPMTNALTAITTTASINTVLFCTNATPINVTLPASPVDGDELVIKATDDNVTVLGNIDGATNKTILGPGVERFRYVDLGSLVGWQTL